MTSIRAHDNRLSPGFAQWIAWVMLLHARVPGIDCHKGEPLVSTSDEPGAPDMIRSEVALWVGALRHGNV